MSDLRLQAEWEGGAGVTAAELAATWCRLVMTVGDRSVTTVEDQRTSSVRRGVYVSAYPLAEWVAQHWWLLRGHVRPSAVPRSTWSWRHRVQQPWLTSHNLRAAGDGMPWPDLTLVPEGSVTRVVWTASPAGGSAPVSYLTSGEEWVATDAVSDGLGRFVDDVLDRLDEAGVSGTPLQREWQLVRQSDPDEVEFLCAAARLGIDPYDVDDALAEDVIALAEEFEPGLLAEFLDSARVGDLREARHWVEHGRAAAVTAPRPALTSGVEHGDAVLRPWRVGYQAARAYRRQLGMGVGDVFATDELVGTTVVATPAGGLQGLVVAERDRVGLVLPEELGTPAQRFAQGRALGLSLLTDRRLLLLEPAHTDVAKTARAFAAELLAPAEGLQTFLREAAAVDPAAFEALARHYRVSPLLVQHQYENQIVRQGF